MSHCLACAIADDLAQHRDQAHPAWSTKRGTLNFAVVVAQRHCTEYQPTTEESA